MVLRSHRNVDQKSFTGWMDRVFDHSLTDLRPMRLLLCLLTCAASLIATAGRNDIKADLNTVPPWMVKPLTGYVHTKPFKPKGTPLPNNRFIGQWTVAMSDGGRMDYWGDAHRFVIRSFEANGTLENVILVDLSSNTRLKINLWKEVPDAKVEDLWLPHASYGSERWSDTLVATGNTAVLMKHACAEHMGTNRNQDTTWYWRTDAYPDLFADLHVWGKLLRHLGATTYLSTLASSTSGNSLKAEWPARSAGQPREAVQFTSVQPGAFPMPALNVRFDHLVEGRLEPLNNAHMGPLPAWIRSAITDLPPNADAVMRTPPPMQRNMADNVFIGTFNAETRSISIERGTQDTTHYLTRYTYWADERRAVLVKDATEDFGHDGVVTYIVDLDADVAVVMQDNGSSLPKLYITDLEEAGLEEFGRGVEVVFKATGEREQILGKSCELHVSEKRYFSHYWFSDVPVNPAFDMARWLREGPHQQFKDIVIFGAADRPLPFRVMRTTLTEYTPGRVAPPKLDFRGCQVRDERWRTKARVEAQESSDGPAAGNAAAPPQRLHDVPPSARPRTPSMFAKALSQNRNLFVGHASWAYDLATQVPLGKTDGKPTVVPPERKITISVDYWSTPDSSLFVVHYPESVGGGGHAVLLDRRQGTRTTAAFRNGALNRYEPQKLGPDGTGASQYWLPDTLTTAPPRTLLGHRCVQRLFRMGWQTSRVAWVSNEVPSIMHDAVSANGGWHHDFDELFGRYAFVDHDGMPMEVKRTFGQSPTVTFKVTLLAPGPVDPNVFKVTTEHWKR
jgi:hypothetical protein